MHEILSILPPGSRVLDLGSGSGSFDASRYDLAVTRADLDRPQTPPSRFVNCSAARLPFQSRSFDALILNHSLEHFEELDESIREMGRVLRKNGFLYVAVPDSSTLTDHAYRWLSRGGGHVNPFSDPAALAERIARITGLRHAATRVLCTSFSFLNRRNIHSRPPGKLILFCNGREGYLRALTFILRRADRLVHTRTSVYGWSFYFGDLRVPDLTTWTNVCVACGSGHPSAGLLQSGRVSRRRILPSIYACPHCGTRNFFTDDVDFGFLRRGPRPLLA